MDDTIIVVQDIAGAGLVEGDILAGNRAQVARQKAIVLPVEPGLLELSAVAGYFRKNFGRGYQLTFPAAGRACPMVLYNVRERTMLHWAAYIVRDVSDHPIRGHLRLATDTRQAQVLAGGLHHDTPPVDAAKETTRHADALGGWAVYGRARLSVQAEGYLGLCIHGALSGARILWSAVTQTLP